MAQLVNLKDGGQMTIEQAQGRVDREQALSKIYDNFCKQRDRWVAYRSASGIEEKWRKWERMYDGSHEEDHEVNVFVKTLMSGPTARGKDANRSRVVINIVRPKVDQAIGRYAEILLPTDDQNWGIKPPTVPDLAGVAADIDPNVIDMATGMPMHEVAGDIIKEAADRAKKMQDEIKDALDECDYNGECRKALMQGTRLGSGVMKGPFPTIRRSKKWTGGKMEINEKTAPTSAYRSCWHIWPDPGCGNNIHRGSGIYEARKVNRKELRQLIGVPGFFDDAIAKVLRQTPTKVQVMPDRKITRVDCDDEMYELWEYHGEIEPDDMETLTSGGEIENVLNVDYGMIVIVNDIIIGALESYNPDGSLPYDIWCHREQEDSPFGIGMPEELEHQQRVVKSAWRQVMDNAAAAAGYHIIFRKGAVVPQGQADREDYVISSRMVWEANDEIQDVSKAFAVMTVDMRVQELLTIVEAAMKFADQETNMPQLMGGERGTAPETVGGMQMLQANAQGPLRFRIKRWDDTITNGQIGRHFDYQMEYSEKEEIKGDFEVEARGATYLLERDIQAQATVGLPMLTANPRYARFIDEKREIEEILKSMRISSAILRTEEELAEVQKAEAESPQQDPRIVASETQLEIKGMDLQDKAQQRDFEATRNQQELALRAQTLEYNREREAAEFELGMTEASLNRDGTLLKLEAADSLSRDQTAAKMRMEALKIDNENARFNAEAALRTSTGQGI